ncbi:MAG: hypothetical protein ACXVHX_29985 [Solirubrobacteraceae bacterium]
MQNLEMIMRLLKRMTPALDDKAIAEEVKERIVELVLDHLAHLLEGDRRRRVTQRCELSLELVAILLGHEADVEERHHLPELHRRALHRPQRGHDLLGRLYLSAFQRHVAPLLAARHVCCAGSRLTDRLACCKPADFGGAPHA